MANYESTGAGSYTFGTISLPLGQLGEPVHFTPAPTASTQHQVNWVVLGPSPTLGRLQIEQSTDGVTWTLLAGPYDCIEQGLTQVPLQTTSPYLRVNVTAFEGTFDYTSEQGTAITVVYLRTSL